MYDTFAGANDSSRPPYSPSLEHGHLIHRGDPSIHRANFIENLRIMKTATIQRHLEELQLISCSLLANEKLTFLEGSESWSEALEQYSTNPSENPMTLESPPTIGVRVDEANVWFAVAFAEEDTNIDRRDNPRVRVSVKGEDITRNEQERWQTAVVKTLSEIADSEYPAYQLISLHLLPMLHDAVEKLAAEMKSRRAEEDSAIAPQETYHVLFTSHHLKSATKRRLLQQWSASLSLDGFAKMGHPGVIYAQGERANVEEFVDNVKAMLWLALKVRFIEPVSVALLQHGSTAHTRTWKEFQKVGEVVEEMRRVGREEFVVEMGIGSAGSSAKAAPLFDILPSRNGPTGSDITRLQLLLFEAEIVLSFEPPLAMSSSLGFKASRAVLTTIAPPIPRAYEWASRYLPTPERPILDMSQGVPGIPPPEVVQKALGVAASSPTSFGYTKWNGELTLRAALVHEMRGIYGKDSDLNADDVALTSGCNLAFVATAMSVADAGDEIILPVPWYFNHQMTLNLLGINAVPLRTRAEDGFVPSVEACRELITSKTKAIVLITPNNPTGATYSTSLLASFALLANENNLALIIDETYRDFITSESPPHSLFSSNAAHPWRQNFIHLYSFSKAYCLPGHRLGAIVASPVLLSSVRSVLDTLQICPPRPIQLALAPLLPDLRGFVNDTAKQLHARHALFKRNLPMRWKVGSQGGYFAFVRHPFPRVGAEHVSRRLAEEAGVVTLPAGFFAEETRQNAEKEEETEQDVVWKNAERQGVVEEDERWIRFSVANVSDEKVVKVCERLASCETEFGWTVEASDSSTSS